MCCFNLSLALGDLRETTQPTQSPLSLPLPLLSHPNFFLCFDAIFFFFNRPADCRKLALFRVWKVISETTQLNWTLVFSGQNFSLCLCLLWFGDAHLEVPLVSGHNRMYSCTCPPSLKPAPGWAQAACLSHLGWMAQTRRCGGRCG